MTWAKYADFVTDLNMTKHADRSYDLAHHAMALSGEAGEVNGKVVKRVFRGSHKITNEELKDELGDVLFHVTALLVNLESTIDEVMEANMQKLRKRVKEGTLVERG